MQRLQKGMCVVITVMVCVLLLLPVRVEAADAIDLTKNVELKIVCKEAEAPLAGIAFSLYQIASLEETGELVVNPAFSQFSVDIRGENDEAWNALTDTLTDYVTDCQMETAANGVTDLDGMLCLPTQEGTLSQGLYLVVAERYTKDDCYYDMAPFLIQLPTLNTQEHQWDYQVTVVPKYTMGVVPETPDADSDGVDGSVDSGPETLPQTGQLWWPVPILLCAGLVLVLLGCLRGRGVEDVK